MLGALVLPPVSAQAAITAQPVATGLNFPSNFTFASDGRIFYAERLSGQIRVLNPATSSNSLFFAVPGLCTASEQGLFGVALHPDPTHSIVYAYATRNVSGACRNQVLRIDSTPSGPTLRVLATSPPASGIHNGGRIMFGPDRNLYVTIGELGSAGNAQSVTTLAGKVLRMTPAGAVPAGNPFAGSFVYAYGLRNVFGFDFDPGTGKLWATDNGPECNDEVDLISAGRNYGWGPSATCSSPPSPPANTNRDGPSPVPPRLFTVQSDGVTGAAFCAGCGLGAASEGALFYGAYNGDIRRVTLTADRGHASSQTVVYRHPSGPLGLESAPNGTLYFSDQSAIYKLVGP